MKILAIRGKNLTSLAGEFEIPFQAEPLASAGLFAISGVTGAGKSTLLDALCLALYDDTPRLLKAGSLGTRLPDVEGETVTPHDTRTLLRRGAADGYAEVDFVGNDGASYRARWSVRRSRARSGGRLQAVEMSLKSLPELQPIGGGNREVKAEIVRRIGLCFEQFTRSVLLAQNEFSTFLKADDNERGELLETLTGIAVYSVLSRRAFERAKLEQAALDRLGDRLADQKPLGFEQRAQLDQECAQAAARLAALMLQKTQLDEQLRWHEALEKLCASESQAEQELCQVRLHSDAAAARRADFERIEAVQAARPLLSECDRLEAAIALGPQLLSRAECALAQGQSTLQQALQARTQVSQVLLQAEQRQRLKAPELDRAKALDAQLEALVPLQLAACRSREEADQTRAHALVALEENQRQRAQTQEEGLKACDWLARQSRLKLLAEGWPRWDTLFAQATRIAREQAGLGAAIAAAQQEEARLNQAGSAADAGLFAAEAAQLLAQQQRLACRAKLAGLNVAGRLQRNSDAQQRREALTGAEQQWLALAGNRTSYLRLDGEAVKLQEDIVLAESALVELVEQQKCRSAALFQAERTLRGAEAAATLSAESLRAALKPHEACPVCGSLEHPYRSVDPLARALLESLHAEEVLCRDALQSVQHQLTVQRTVAQACRSQLQQLGLQLPALQEAIDSGLAAWQACPLAAELCRLVEPSIGGWFAAQKSALRAQLTDMAVEEQAERAAQMALDQAQAHCDCVASKLLADKDTVAFAKTQLAKACAGRLAAIEKLADAQRRCEAILAELNEAFENQDWIEAWRNSPESFHQKLKAVIVQWQAKCKSRDESQILQGKLEVARSALQDALHKACAEAARSTAAEAASTAEIEKMRADRNALFGGKATDAVQAELEAAICSARTGLASEDLRVLQTTGENTRLQEVLHQARRQQQQLGQEALVASQRLSGWLERYRSDGAALTVEQLRVLLAPAADWLSDERKFLQALDAALAKARILLQERAGLRERHELKRPSQQSAQEVMQALSLLEALQHDAQWQVSALQLSIAQDSARRQQCADLLAELEKQEASNRVWAQLSELIGSADGKKFRNYAQQFTLDVLLCYANHHLAELSRRYRLERIRDTLALMVVDQDMGDELRSVHSLSGGESFLVSLALALGLASLSSNRVRVESLFIDEGFGSLDAETLSVAMDALDGLQAMGRKVGVISHVQEMTERISVRVLVQRLYGGKSQVVIV